MIKESGEIVINLTTKKLSHATDYCGVRSGRDVDKWKECRLTKGSASSLEYAPVIEEAPVNIECKVKSIQELGSHHMFLAEVTAVQVDESYMDDKGKFDLNSTGLIAYSHGEYLDLGNKLGTFGYSVRKKQAPRRQKKAGCKKADAKDADGKKANGKNAVSRKAAGKKRTTARRKADR